MGWDRTGQDRTEWDRYYRFDRWSSLSTLLSFLSFTTRTILFLTAYLPPLSFLICTYPSLSILISTYPSFSVCLTLLDTASDAVRSFHAWRGQGPWVRRLTGGALLQPEEHSRGSSQPLGHSPILFVLFFSTLITVTNIFEIHPILSASIPSIPFFPSHLFFSISPHLLLLFRRTSLTSKVLSACTR